jgi:hypothetical protein
VGAWHVVATTLPFWQTRGDPIIRYEPLPDGRWRDTVEFVDLRKRPKRVIGYDTPDPNWPGAFEWRGAGGLAWCRSRWCFVDVEAPDTVDGWALTWFSAATFGVTPAGFDVYARDRHSPAAMRPLHILERVESAVGQTLGSGWFHTHRGGSARGGEPLR